MLLAAYGGPLAAVQYWNSLYWNPIGLRQSLHISLKQDSDLELKSIDRAI
jgi:hypothetical protein